MNPVASASEPLFWSFGPLPRSSSEGFLVTFTPRRVWEESVFARRILTEESSEAHRFIPFTFMDGKEQKIQEFGVSDSFVGMPRQVTRLSYPGDLSSLTPFSDRGLNRRAHAALWRGRCCFDLMIPRLYVEGILVALLPTDEGCRRPHPKYPRTVKFSGEYYWVSRKERHQLVQILTQT
jgi:hypothetical protein